MSERITTINPATEEAIAEYEFQDAEAVESAVDASLEAFRHWRRLPLQTRVDCIRVFAEALQAARVTLAEMMTQEMGKPIRESLSELDKSISSCHTLCEVFPRWREQLHYDVPKGFTVAHEPMGVLLGIMPWNFPLWQVVRFAVPALLCGNSILLKHAPNTWGSAEFISELFRQALPHAVYANLRIDIPQVSTLIADQRVRGVSLTGSRRAGISVAQQAGQNLKKCVLELGGSDAYVILDDADVESSAELCARSRLINAGQSCVSAKRFIVTKKNAAQFTEKFIENMKNYRMGDPTKADVDVGPLARKDLRDLVDTQVKQSLKQGAKLSFGSEVGPQKGFYYAPAVLTDVRPGFTAFDEEIFGPVAAVTVADNEAQALQFANRSRYGLGGAVFSRDTERAKHLALTEMDAGMVFVNDFVRSDAHVPFGGVKDSGLGRELGREGAFEFTNVKTLFVKS
jgi:succinate-semialdehyde dehydrogenase / glutarate-semialdehyde dehydrogenase